MPLSEQFDNYGTNADGSKSQEYCTFCFQKGAFTQPDLTLEGMVALSVEVMTRELGFAEPEARRLSNQVIPQLKRWRP